MQKITLYSVICSLVVVLYFFFQGSQDNFAVACATNFRGALKNVGSWKNYWIDHSKVSKNVTRIPSSGRLLPDALNNPWGGAEASWAPEASLANAVSEALNDAWSETGVEDVLVSVPIKLLKSGERPYGDGQTNAAISFESWNKKQPPIIAILVLYKTGEKKIKIRVHQDVPVTARGLSIRFRAIEEVLTVSTKLAGGYVEFQWSPPTSLLWGDLFQNRVAFLQPVGAKGWFPLDFRDVVRKNSELLREVPESQKNLGRGDLLDPELVGVQAGRSPNIAFPFLNMRADNFGSDIGGVKYFPVPGTGIHNVFPNGRITSVGRGFTLVMEKFPAPFKMAYICFDKRSDASSGLKPIESDFGVPSGGGWHEIGDNAETVFNSLENAPALFGYANGLPVSKTPADPDSLKTPSQTFSYGLSDIAVFRLLKPGYALITASGDTSRSEDLIDHENDRLGKNLPHTRGQGSIFTGRNYHWFAFHHPHEVCAVEWVHPCVPTPTNHLGLQCK